MLEDSRQQYRQQVILHSEDLKSLNQLREEIDSLRRDLEEKRLGEQRAIQNLEDSKNSWQEQKNILQHDIEELERKCSDLSEQNNILLDQMEKLSQNIMPTR